MSIMQILTANNDYVEHLLYGEPDPWLRLFEPRHNLGHWVASDPSNPGAESWELIDHSHDAPSDDTEDNEQQQSDLIDQLESGEISENEYSSSVLALGQSSSSQGPRSDTPQATTPQATTPQATTPQATTPQATTPQATTPQATTPQATTPQATTPQATTPQATTPQATTQEQSDLIDQLESGEISENEYSSSVLALGQSSSSQATTPQATTPQATTPQATTPQATTPQATTQEQSDLIDQLESGEISEDEYRDGVLALGQSSSASPPDYQADAEVLVSRIEADEGVFASAERAALVASIAAELERIAPVNAGEREVLEEMRELGAQWDREEINRRVATKLGLTVEEIYGKSGILHLNTSIEKAKAQLEAAQGVEGVRLAALDILGRSQVISDESTLRWLSQYLEERNKRGGLSRTYREAFDGIRDYINDTLLANIDETQNVRRTLQEIRNTTKDFDVGDVDALKAIADDPKQGNLPITVYSRGENGERIPSTGEDGEPTKDADGNVVYETKTITMAEHIRQNILPNATYLATNAEIDSILTDLDVDDPADTAQYTTRQQSDLIDQLESGEISEDEYRDGVLALRQSSSASRALEAIANDPDQGNLPITVYSRDENGERIPFTGENGDPIVDGDGNPVYETKTITMAEHIRQNILPNVKKKIYLEDGDITPDNAPAAWNNNLDTVKKALNTLNNPNATSEELREAAAALNSLADAFEGSGFERTWDHDNDASTPDKPITAAEQLKKWASSIHTEYGLNEVDDALETIDFTDIGSLQSLADDPNSANSSITLIDTDEDGKPIPELDENGEPALDDDGKPVYKTKTITLREYITSYSIPRAESFLESSDKFAPSGVTITDLNGNVSQWGSRLMGRIPRRRLHRIQATSGRQFSVEG